MTESDEPALIAQSLRKAQASEVLLVAAGDAEGGIFILGRIANKGSAERTGECGARLCERDEPALIAQSLRKAQASGMVRAI